MRAANHAKLRRGLCVFAILTLPARPSADFGLVDLRTRGFLRSSNRPRKFSKVDQPKVRRGSCGRFENRKKPRVFKGRPAQSPQRVARAISKSQKNHEFSKVDQPKVRRASRGRFENRKKARVFEGPPAQSPQRVTRAISKSQKTTSFRRSTSPKSAERRAGDLKIAKNHEFSKVDQPKVRRGSRGQFENRKKPRVFKGRPAQSPQRVARAISKSQKTTSFRRSTSPKSAEGRAGDLKIAKNHEFLKVGGPKPRQGHEKPLAK